MASKGYFMARKSRLSYQVIGVGYTKYRKHNRTNLTLLIRNKIIYLKLLQNK